MKSQIVLDPSVLVAALRSRRGAAFHLISLLPAALFEINLSVPLVFEYVEVSHSIATSWGSRSPKAGVASVVAPQHGGPFRPAETGGVRPLAPFGPRPGMRWREWGPACQQYGSQLTCTLLAYWDEGGQSFLG
jgi:hypothetical protein